MGARPLKRAIQNVIEDKLAEEILKKNVKPGDSVTCSYSGSDVVFKVSVPKQKNGGKIYG